jgi:hypothetical protein
MAVHRTPAEGDVMRVSPCPETICAAPSLPNGQERVPTGTSAVLREVQIPLKAGDDPGNVGLDVP